MEISEANAQRIDAEFKELLAEFMDHKSKIKLADTTITDDRVIFEGWALRKIAGLHCLVFDLFAALDQIDIRKRV